MKRHHNLLLLLAVVLLAALPLWLVQKPLPDADGKPVELFAGADNKAMALIGDIAPNYVQWFKPIMEPASGEIASLLFALQAALGAGFIGYYLGVSVTRERLKRELLIMAQREAQARSENPTRAD